MITRELPVVCQACMTKHHIHVSVLIEKDARLNRRFC